LEANFSVTVTSDAPVSTKNEIVCQLTNPSA
jgi:hypothetical protein